MRQLKLTLDADLHAAIRTFALADGERPSTFVRRLLRQFLRGRPRTIPIVVAGLGDGSKSDLRKSTTMKSWVGECDLSDLANLAAGRSITVPEAVRQLLWAYTANRRAREARRASPGNS
jgi:hypothetical protein